MLKDLPHLLSFIMRKAWCWASDILNEEFNEWSECVFYFLHQTLLIKSSSLSSFLCGRISTATACHIINTTLWYRLCLPGGVYWNGTGFRKRIFCHCWHKYNIFSFNSIINITQYPCWSQFESIALPPLINVHIRTTIHMSTHACTHDVNGEGTIGLPSLHHPEMLDICCYYIQPLKFSSPFVLLSPIPNCTYGPYEISSSFTILTIILVQVKCVSWHDRIL